VFDVTSPTKCLVTEEGFYGFVYHDNSVDGGIREHFNHGENEPLASAYHSFGNSGG
jgi:hypothetical protein